VDLGTEHPALAAPPLLEGLCSFLDAAPPARTPTGLTLRVWQAVGAKLRTLAASVCSLQNTLRTAQAGLRRAQQQQQQGAPGAVEAAAIEMRNAHGALETAVGEWQTAARLLRHREWWAEGHLALPATEPEAVGAMERSADAAAALAALALVHAAQLAALERERLGDLRERRRAPAMPLPETAPVIAAALRQRGAVTAAEQLDGDVEQISAAHEAAAELQQGPARAAAFLASAAVAAATFESEAGREWAPPEGWRPIPIGATHPELGPIAQLPDPWWLAFPLVRRRRARQTRLEEEERGAERAALLQAAPALPMMSQQAAAAAAGAADAAGTPMEIVGSQPTQRTLRRVRFEMPE
jgi:hypothetical protein